MSSIALVDDEKSIRELVRIALEQENHQVREYADGLEALAGFQESPPDLVVLDILMPRMDGMELCRKIRALPWGKATPVIFLSSRDEEIDKILGLESGGDDYVSKPFSLRELLARIRAGLRRTREQGPGAGPEGLFPAPFVRGDLALDENRFAASWKTRPLELTVTEFRILQSLAAHPGFIKTREQLMAAAFPEDNFFNDRAADSHIKRIRRKFLELDPDFSRLESVYGLGFRWRESAGDPAPGEKP
jgi:two-component system response regulator ChvI